jgi:uncharacterized coiled-coil protein SlyX
MSDTGDDGPWLTISEAAERTGRKLDAMRALVRRGRLPRKKGNRGEWLVQIPGAVMRPALGPDSDSDLDHALDGASDSELAALREQVADLRVGLARAEERAVAAERLASVEIAARDQLVTELRGALVRERELGGEMRDLLRRLTTKFDEREQQICALRAELAAARRPWWRRMLSA